MPRQAAGEAQNAQSTAGKNAAQYGANASGELGTLNPQAQSLINSKGYDPATLGAITNAGMGAVNSAFGSASGNINRTAARTGNEAGIGGQQDALAMNKGVAGGQEAGDIQIQNANFANQQRMSGLNLLNSLYGQNVNAQTGNQGIQTGDINAQTQASPGWVQNLTGITSALGSLVPKSPPPPPGGCWIAAKIFGGWNDPRTNLVREWIFDKWARESKIGYWVSGLYHRYGLALSRNEFAVRLLKPLFLLALRKAERWQPKLMMMKIS